VTLSERLAAWGAALRWEDIPQGERALVGLRALDTAGLILAGRETDAARALSGLAGQDHPAMTALVYGALAHCRDFDDTFLDSVVHPGSPVVSAALAAGEALGAADEDVGAAIVAGYEAAARIGAAAGRRFHARGFHATGVVGPLAAALAAARVHRLSPQATADAIGLAASMSGGLMAFADDGSWSKWLHAGWAAHGGIVAAQLAAQGFRGPHGALDGRHNLFAAFIALTAPAVDELCGDLGRRWAGSAAHFKYYPCAHVIQPYLDAAIALREEHRFGIDAIIQVTCAIAPWAVPIVCEPRTRKLRPESDMDAIASLPYQVAVALADGRVDLEALGAASRARPEVLGLARRVEPLADASLGEGFDGRMTIALASGERLESTVTSAPPERGKLLAKFRANVLRAMTKDNADALERALTARALPKFGEVALILRYKPLHSKEG
jgi:2-methylcitrate dehydratase PrpD